MLCGACDKLAPARPQPGLNYSQPVKWRLTYEYRVPDITAAEPLRRERPSAFDEQIPAVGPGTWEVWLTEPHVGEQVRQVKRVAAHPEPTAESLDETTGARFAYYDFAADGYLPREITASVSYEFITLAAEALPLDAAPGDADQLSTPEQGVSQRFFGTDKPFTLHPEMTSVARACLRQPDMEAQARAAYDYITGNFTYDEAQAYHIFISGQGALTDARRSWQNKQGICDEISVCYCTLLRQCGIASRPVLGFAHVPIEGPEGLSLHAAGHAWTELYLPGIGWVPADPTWDIAPDGQALGVQATGGGGAAPSGSQEYFGRLDSLRIPLYKDFDYTLQPAPKTPGAKPRELWNIGCAERRSGVKSFLHGYAGVDGEVGASGLGWHRAADATGYNFDIILEALGPPSADELAALEAELKQERAHFISGPPIQGDFPIQTLGRGKW